MYNSIFNSIVNLIKVLFLSLLFSAIAGMIYSVYVYYIAKIDVVNMQFFDHSFGVAYFLFPIFLVSVTAFFVLRRLVKKTYAWVLAIGLALFLFILFAIIFD